MEKVIIQNCVYLERVVITTYPQWSDYGCLTNAIQVVYEDGDTYKDNIYATEDVGDGAYEVEVASWGDTTKYKNYVLEKECEEMRKHNFTCWMRIRDEKYNLVLKVIRGRKYPIGLEFTSTKATKYEIPGTYGHGVIYYIDGIDNEGNKVHISCDNIEFVSIKEVK